MDYHENNIKDFLQINGRQVLQRVDNNYSLRYFTENEIRNITNGYSTILGQGAFGQVYKGTLDDQSAVAVKEIYPWDPERGVCQGGDSALSNKPQECC
ncbi:hypothetical protein ACP4OV_016498 [Aristida adscensionis]